MHAKLKFKKYFPDREFDMKLTRNEPGKTQNIRRNFQEIPVQDKLLPDPIFLSFIEWIITIEIYPTAR